MGCFISCFRSRDRDGKVQSRPHACSNPDSYYDQESLEERLVLDDQFDSPFLNGETDTEDNFDHLHTLDEELRLEAEQLKLCGAIPQTPMEIRKSNNRIALRDLNGTDPSPKSDHASAYEKVQLSVQHEQENSPDKTKFGTPNHGKETSISCQSNHVTVSVEGMRGDKLNLTPVSQSLNPNSPYPTPIVLNDDMETPATKYSYPEISITGRRRTRIPAQYAFPALKSAPKVVSSSTKSSDLEKENDLSGECSFTRKSLEMTPKVLISEETPKSSVETSEVLISNFSYWLKPPTALSCRNGIPNTTKKYKEDQQIRWHTTPFEERLEKVLTDEKLPPSRKLILKSQMGSRDSLKQKELGCLVLE